MSIGAVLIPDDCIALEDILAYADIAMYRAKTKKASALVFYGDMKQRSDASRA